MSLRTAVPQDRYSRHGALGKAAARCRTDQERGAVPERPARHAEGDARIALVGPNAPEGFQPFCQHPPIPGVQCTQCHSLSRSGNFIFEGGCFDCHQRNDFTGIHTHDPGALEFTKPRTAGAQSGRTIVDDTTAVVVDVRARPDRARLPADSCVELPS